MNTRCLENFFDCQGLPEAKIAECKEKKSRILENSLRTFLFVVSFAFFSFMVGPEVQRTEGPVKTVARAASVAKKQNAEVVNVSKSDKARAALVLSLLLGGR